MTNLLRTFAKRQVYRASIWSLYVREAFLLLLGRDRLIYSERAGALVSGPGFQRAVVMALHPDESGLTFALNAMKGFAANGFFVLAVSSKRLPPWMSERILAHCDHLIERYSIGRDFGSYKLGFSWLKRQDFYGGLDTLALVNDSMYYPQSIAAAINEMLQQDAPWMALHENYHLSQAKWSFSNLASMLRLNLFTYRDLRRWLENPFGTPPLVPLAEQLSLELS
jgi:hypothetical protein